MSVTVNDLERARRFICFGSDTGLLTIGKATPCKEYASAIGRLIGEGKGEEVVREIVHCYTEKKYNSKTTLIFALAYCFKSSDIKTRQAACKAFPNICQLPTDLFHFVDCCKTMSDQHKGWGRSLRTLVSNWYNDKEAMALVDLGTRFKSGCSWSHVDILRLSHTNPVSDETGVVIKYLMKGLEEAKKLASEKKSPGVGQVLEYLQAVDTVKTSSDEHAIARLIEQYALKKEHVPTKLLQSLEIWAALINNVPVDEILLNITKLAGLGVLNNGHFLLPTILGRLCSESSIKESGVSPMSVLIALRNYEQGKGKLKWVRNESVASALNIAFYEAIKNNVVTTKKRILLAIKVSHGMPQAPVRGSRALSCMIAASGVATIFNQTEEKCSLVFFSSSVTPVATTRPMDLAQTCEAIAQAAMPEIPVLACDVSAPIRWAQQKKQVYDAFIILTDSKESTGLDTPASALQSYRRVMKLPTTKLVVCGLTSKHLHFADANDSGMMDIAGFDATVPDTILKFVGDN